MNTQVDHAKQQAQLQLESITAMVNALHTAYDLQEADVGGSDEPLEQARERIQEDALSVSVRSGWYDPCLNCGDVDRTEYNILLCTGGPACRVIGTMSEHCEPDSARIEYQDWGTPWTNYPLTSDQEAIVLEYAQQFYYGE